MGLSVELAQEVSKEEVAFASCKASRSPECQLTWVACGAEQSSMVCLSFVCNKDD